MIGEFEMATKAYCSLSLLNCRLTDLICPANNIVMHHTVLWDCLSVIWPFL